MLLTATLFFATIARISAETSFSRNATTSSSSSSFSSASLAPSSSSSTSLLRDSTLTSSIPSASNLNPTTTSNLSDGLVPSNANSAASSDIFPTITAAPYYNPADFVNPYFYMILATRDDQVLSHLHSCATIWDASFQGWRSTAKFTTGPTVTAITVTTTKVPWVSTQKLTTETIYQLFPASTYVTTIQSGVTLIPPETATLTSSGYGPLYYVDDHLDFTASEPCCEQCTIYGGNVQVYFWPPATETPSVSTLFNNRTQAPTLSTLVDESGFTFTSPSTYVAFQSLYAANLCGDVGPRYAATTLAFSPGELSTSIGYHVKPSGASKIVPWLVPLKSFPEIQWTRATFGDQPQCGHKVDVFWGLGGMAFVGRGDALSAASSLLSEFPMPGSKVSDLITAFSFTYDPCSPTLSIPSQILTMASEWRVCAPPVTAFFDPPYTLTKGGQLSAINSNAMAPAPVSTALPNLPVSTKATSSPAVVTSSPPDTGDPVPPPISSSPDPPASTASSILEIQPTRILTPDPAADPASQPEANSPPATTPVVNGPGTSNQPNPAQDPAGQSPATTNPPPPVAIITLGSSTITADQSSKFVIASQTLTRGGQVTVSGTVVSLASDGGFVVIGGTSTQAVATQTPSQTSPPHPAQYSVITISGTVISILPGATEALVGSKTVPLSEVAGVTTGSDGNVGWNIITIGGFAPGLPTPPAQGTETGDSSYNGTVFTGGSARSKTGRGVWDLALLLGVGLLGLCWL